MPRIISRCPYIKGGTTKAAAHLENLVGYIATRQGVERVDPGRANWNATKNQRTIIEKLLREFPLNRGLFEYEDYLAAPTRANASDFITRAIEDNLDRIAKRENYLEYIATPPRAADGTSRPVHRRGGIAGAFSGGECRRPSSRQRVAPHHFPTAGGRRPAGL